jgi:NAD(P)-dependent dehydrogenase (short-subunit alcohol dehydrogenase family)
MEMETGTHRSMQHSQVTWRSSPAAPAEPVGGWRHAGATVYVSGRTTREGRSPMNRPETIEETAELVTEAGGRGIAVRTDHSDPDQVEALIDRIRGEQDGRLDVLVNDIWGGRPVHRLGSPVYGLTDVDGSQPDFWAYLNAFLAERGQTFSEWVEQRDVS